VASASLYSSWYNVRWLSTSSKWIFDRCRCLETNVCRYEQLQLRANSLREELHTEIERMLDDIVRFKLHVQRSLEEYEQFIADEVERSCEEQDLLVEEDDEEMAEESS
jgi:SMC interacting uncharacterized protein involved in chromosome segregation